MPRVQVNLQRVVCFDPEDVTGSGDEFYVVGAVTDGANAEGVATQPIQVAAGQTQSFGVGGGTVFDKDVPSDRILKVALTAFDEDSAKDWSKQSQVVDDIAAAVSKGLGAIPNPYTAGAAVLLPFVVSVVGGIFSLDQDDNLGSYTGDFPVWSLTADNPQQWQFNGQWGGGLLGFSKWSYALHYTITLP